MSNRVSVSSHAATLAMAVTLWVPLPVAGQAPPCLL
jgi:hypothetical protein